MTQEARDDGVTSEDQGDKKSAAWTHTHSQAAIFLSEEKKFTVMLEPYILWTQNIFYGFFIKVDHILEHQVDFKKFKGKEIFYRFGFLIRIQ